MSYSRGDVVLVLYPEMGLRTDSVVMADNLATILEVEIDRRLGNMADMMAVDAALRHTLSL